MQSVKKSKEGQEATPTDERASGVEREFSEMKRRMGELEKFLSLKQSIETQRKPPVVPEASQCHFTSLFFSLFLNQKSQF